MTGLHTPDYLAIGHLTVDLTPDGPMLGGSVLYGALVAARLGARAAVVTRANLSGLDKSLRDQLDQVAAEVELVVQNSQDTTTFLNRERAGRREQELHGWGGEIDLSGVPPMWRSAEVIHLAPVAQEIDHRTTGRLSGRLLACTPQGWMRSWNQKLPSPVRRTPLRLPNDLLARIDAMVVSSNEYVIGREAVEAVGGRALAVVTLGAQGATVIDRGRKSDLAPFPAKVVDTTGAGDVFAATLFYMRAQREGVAMSVRYAGAAAALAIGSRGPLAVPGRDEIEELLDLRDDAF
jgi:sugar/nucleoside kinase (ribokinase family)